MTNNMNTTTNTLIEENMRRQFIEKWAGNGVSNLVIDAVLDDVAALLAEQKAKNVEEVEKRLPTAMHEYHRWALKHPAAGPEERASQKRHLALLFVSSLRSHQPVSE